MIKHNLRFSLTEFLVVAAILIVLLSLLTPFMNNMIENGRQIECANHLRQMNFIFENYHEDQAGQDVMASMLTPKPPHVLGSDTWYNTLYQGGYISVVRPFGLLDSSVYYHNSFITGNYNRNTDYNFVCPSGSDHHGDDDFKFINSQTVRVLNGLGSKGTAYMGLINTTYTASAKMGTFRSERALKPQKLIRVIDKYQYSNLGASISYFVELEALADSRRVYTINAFSRHVLSGDQMGKIQSLMYDGHVGSFHWTEAWEANAPLNVWVSEVWDPFYE